MALKSKLIEQLLVENNGILKTADVMAAGVSKEYFYQYAKRKGLEKAAHGIYVSPDAWPDEMYLLQAQFPKAIYSADAAFRYRPGKVQQSTAYEKRREHRLRQIGMV